ncbi:MAG: TetR/AcrR family transcriptional regulator [Bacteroidota bacterium]
MKTRDKILQTARLMFNEHGVGDISSRNISDELKISYGNLCYHFPKKADLIHQLYMNMQSELDEELSNLQQEIYGFDFMVQSLRRMLEVMHKYKFVFLDFTQLTRKYPKIKAHGVRQYQNRMLIGRRIFTFLSNEGYLKEVQREGHYDMIVHNFLMILNLWVMDAELYYTGSNDHKVDHYLELLYSFVRASLTKKGADAFNEVYASFMPPIPDLSTPSELEG